MLILVFVMAFYKWFQKVVSQNMKRDPMMNLNILCFLYHVHYIYYCYSIHTYQKPELIQIGDECFIVLLFYVVN